MDKRMTSCWSFRKQFAHNFVFLRELGNSFIVFFFFFQAEDGIRDADVTGVQTCALPIYWIPGMEGVINISIPELMQGDIPIKRRRTIRSGRRRRKPVKKSLRHWLDDYY